MTFVVAPFDHVMLPLLQLPVKLVELPLQIVPGLLAVKPTLGADGIGFTIKFTVALLLGKVSQVFALSLHPT